MDTPTPSPTTSAADSTAPTASAPALPAPAPITPVAEPTAPALRDSVQPGLSASAQAALGSLLVLTLVLLAFRGYGSGFNTRPTERAAAPITDLNRADRAELEQVPGIGPTLAKAIEEHRTKKGPFKSVDELRLVRGVGPITLDKVRPFLRVDPTETARAAAPDDEPKSPEPLVLERKSPPAAQTAARGSGSSKKLQPGDPPIDLNAATVDDLTRLPGIGPVIAQHIIAARAAGPFKSVADLGHIKGIGPKTLEKIKPFAVVK